MDSERTVENKEVEVEEVKIEQSEHAVSYGLEVSEPGSSDMFSIEPQEMLTF